MIMFLVNLCAKGISGTPDAERMERKQLHVIMQTCMGFKSPASYQKALSWCEPPTGGSGTYTPDLPKQKERIMGYLMKEVQALADKDVTPELREVLTHLAQVIEDTESKVEGMES